MGTPIVPTRLKIITGDAKKHPDRINRNEPQPPLGAKRPAWLTPAAKKHWPKIAPMLEEIGVLTTADTHALALFCESFARWQDAQEHIQRSGEIVISTATGFKVSPYVEVANAAFDQMRRLLVEFGMTPASRTRVSKVTAREIEKPKTGLASFRHKT